MFFGGEDVRQVERGVGFFEGFQFGTVGFGHGERAILNQLHGFTLGAKLGVGIDADLHFAIGQLFYTISHEFHGFVQLMLWRVVVVQLQGHCAGSGCSQCECGASHCTKNGKIAFHRFPSRLKNSVGFVVSRPPACCFDPDGLFLRFS